MADKLDKQDCPDDSASWQVLRVDASDTPRLRQALALLLTGQLRHADAAVDQFLHFLRQQQVAMEHLWIIQRHNDPRLAAMIAINPGRTAMLFLSPALRSWQPAAARQLLQHIVQEQDAEQATMIQALLDPVQEREAAALADAGFEKLATLMYLQRRLNGRLPAVDLAAEGLRLVHWQEDEPTRRLFQRAILDSYQQTRDCPGLLGLRSIEDIMAGHRATGVFEPELWSVVLRGDEPAAVLLLSDLPHQHAMELVYLGVSLPQRGNGLGRRLMHHAMLTAASRRAVSMVLAVDESNTPAVRLYRSLHFLTTARKQAWIYRLPRV